MITRPPTAAAGRSPARREHGGRDRLRPDLRRDRRDGEQAREDRARRGVSARARRRRSRARDALLHRQPVPAGAGTQPRRRRPDDRRSRRDRLGRRRRRARASRTARPAISAPRSAHSCASRRISGLFRETLTPARLYALLTEIADASGKNAQKRRRILCERIFSACTDPLEATYVVKIMTGELRIGLREGLVVDAVAQAFERDPRTVRRAASAAGDLGAVAVAAKHDALDQVTIAYHAPIAFMLATPVAYGSEYKELAADDMAGRRQVRRDPRAGARDARTRLALLPHAQRRRRVVSGGRRRVARAARLVRPRRRDRRRA